MRVEDVVGYRIARAREDAGMPQAEVGELLGQLLGKPWSRQAVSAAEKGHRSFTAAELMAFALVLNVSVELLVTPPESVNAVTLADGAPLDARLLRGGYAASSAVDENLRELVGVMSRLRKEVGAASAAVGAADNSMTDVSLLLHGVATTRGIDSGKALLDLPTRAPRPDKGPG